MNELRSNGKAAVKMLENLFYSTFLEELALKDECLRAVRNPFSLNSRTGGQSGQGCVAACYTSKQYAPDSVHGYGCKEIRVR